ncbi:MAG: hypothetical protein HY803_04260 [candidate division NC10 bacterium]|nr:hypothetical protein [candidate division NC10 bacterium]
MNATAAAPESTQALLELLNSAKNRFTPADCGTKVSLLRTLREREVRDVACLVQFHETLCFLRAYPDSPEVLRLVEQALEGFAARVDLVKATGRSAECKKLRDSGIVHTTVYYPYPHAMAKWLVNHFPRDVEMDWEDDAGVDKVRGILPLLVAYAENDALDDERIALRDWVRAAKGTRDVSDLQWLLELLHRSPLPPEIIRNLYDGAELLLGWELCDAAASRTLAGCPAGRIFYQRRPLKRGQMDFPREIRKPLPALKVVPPRTAEALIHLFRCALSVRNRELHPLLYANPQDVMVADVVLVLKNGVPVSYGGGGPLLDRLEIAGNIFETFRQGESAYIFSQVYRACHNLCGSYYFLVPRYQVGYENDEALDSGAFWFYYKLGFRPEDPEVLKLSEDEQAKIKADPAYRSSRKVLEQLSRSYMSLLLKEGDGRRSKVLQPGDLGLRVSRHIAQKFQGDRAAAIRAATQQVAQHLDIRAWRRWSGPEQMALERLSPILVLIPDLARWSSAEKRSLVRIIRAKGGRSEAAYVRLLREHHRLARSLRELANSATPLPVPTRQTGPMSPGNSP